MASNPPYFRANVALAEEAVAVVVPAASGVRCDLQGLRETDPQDATSGLGLPQVLLREALALIRIRHRGERSMNVAQQLGHLAHPRDGIEALGVLLQTIEVFELRLQVGHPESAL